MEIWNLQIAPFVTGQCMKAIEEGTVAAQTQKPNSLTQITFACSTTAYRALRAHQHPLPRVAV